MKLKELVKKLSLLSSDARDARIDKRVDEFAQYRREVLDLIRDIQELVQPDSESMPQSVQQAIHDARLCIQDISDRELNNQLTVALHKKLMDELGLPYEGFSVGEAQRQRTNHCHNCKQSLDSQRHIECKRCHCMICQCGACMCMFGKLLK